MNRFFTHRILPIVISHLFSVGVRWFLKLHSILNLLKFDTNIAIHVVKKIMGNILMENNNKPSKKELIDMLKEMNNNIEKLPPHAQVMPTNHYDFSALLILLTALFEAET